MRFHSVEMLDRLVTEPSYYDCAIFASGFEARATYVARNLVAGVAKRRVALGFPTDTTVLSREVNDLFFADHFGEPVHIQTDVEDETFMLEQLATLETLEQKGVIRLLVDYSAMTRTWYGTLLTWARFLENVLRIEIDFVYAYGRYLNEFQPLAISEISSLAGFEGVSGGFRRTAAIFGLGYDKYATLAVYDRLEPDLTYCYVAVRGDDDPNAAKVLLENSEIIEGAKRTFPLPLGDVTSAFRILCENVALLDADHQVVMVPMGPKPHVLATLLASIRLPSITCLHARGKRSVPVQVEPTGATSIARVVFVP
jgi:hypothetical protein